MKEFFVKKNEHYFSIPSWEDMDSRLTVGFTTKNGGVSKGSYNSLNTGFHVADEKKDVVKNRGLIAEKVKIPLQCWVGAKQTHRNHIVHVTKAFRGQGAADYESAINDTDGLYTTEKGVLLTLCFADCVPIYYYAPKHGYIGIVHAGWKGTVAEIAVKMIDKWKEHGIDPKDIMTAIGPSICGNCYIVDDKVIKQVRTIIGEQAVKPYYEIEEGQYHLDLKELNRFILNKAGVQDVLVTNLCTSCQKDEFFSHRRDLGKTGRLMSFIGWKEDSL